MIGETLAERLRVLRALKGVTAEQAASGIGINRHTLAALERGSARHPEYATLKKLSNYYGVDVVSLMEGDDIFAEAPGPRLRRARSQVHEAFEAVQEAVGELRQQLQQAQDIHPLEGWNFFEKERPFSEEEWTELVRTLDTLYDFTERYLAERRKWDETLGGQE